jgi:hypothetical protein
MTEKSALLICCTVISALRSLTALLPHFVKSERFESLPTHNKWHLWDRNLSFFFYLLVESLFLAFVIWGPQTVGEYIVPQVSDTPVILWLTILSASTSALFVSSFIIVRHYRLLTSTFRSMEFVCTLAFLVDNCINTSLHIVAAIIALKLLCQVFFVTDMHIYIPIIQMERQRKLFIDKDDDDENEKNFNINVECDTINEKIEALFKEIQRVEPRVVTLEELKKFVNNCLKRADDIDKIHDIESMDVSSSASTPSSSVDSDSKSKTK